MHSIDIFVQNYFSLIRTSQLTELAYLATILFDVSAHFILVSICTAILVYIIRGHRHTLLFGASLISVSIIVYFLKSFFNVSRPLDGVLSVFGPSFPSYHATVVTVFFVMLMYIFDRKLSSTQRVIFNSACIIAILCISFSRIYLGVHWLSDVLFGMFLGILISYISIIIFRYCNVSQNKTSMLE